MQKDTLDCLIDVLRLNYRKMTCYLEQLQQITEAFLNNVQDDAELATFSVEIWNTIFEEELNLESNHKGTI